MAAAPDNVESAVKQLAHDIPALDEYLLARYLNDIVSWNARIPLVSRISTIPVLMRLVRQSALLHDFVREIAGPNLPRGKVNVVDVGTGAGFPGVIWKMVDQSAHVTLIERNQKKATFLQRVASTLGFSGLDIIERDAREISLQPAMNHAFDVALMFAVGRPADVYVYVERLLCPGGWYATVRPRNESKTPAEMGERVKFVAAREEPFGSLCVYRKIGSREPS